MLSMVRTLHGKNRYIGILTELSVDRKPVSFKCICVKTEYYRQLNLPMIKNLLMQSDIENAPNSLRISEKDITEFYSDKCIVG